jgi:RNA polymerase sigma factor (sigma-70 family)
MTTTTTSTTKIAELSSRLNRYSYCITGPELTPEDSYQEMILAFLKKAGDDPTFIAQKDAYQVRYASWVAMQKAHAGNTYRKYVCSLEDLTAGENDDMDVFEVFPSNDGSVEDQVIANENAEEMNELISTLSPSNQTVIAMIYLGYSQVEIAEQLGVSKVAVSQRKATIRKHLTQVSGSK